VSHLIVGICNFGDIACTIIFSLTNYVDKENSFYLLPFEFFGEFTLVDKRRKR